MPSVLVDDIDGFTLATNDVWVVGPNVNSERALINGMGTTLINFGNIISSGPAVFQNTLATENTTFRNEASGLISGSAGVRFADTNTQAFNDGIINGFREEGFQFTLVATDSSLHNTGTIRGQTAGVIVSASPGTNILIDNAGLIEGRTMMGLELGAGASPEITNTGTIRGATQAITPTWGRSST
jgi:hypothetical protein